MYKYTGCNPLCNYFAAHVERVLEKCYPLSLSLNLVVLRPASGAARPFKVDLLCGIECEIATSYLKPRKINRCTLFLERFHFTANHH
jgi:hypothetical protein